MASASTLPPPHSRLQRPLIHSSFLIPFQIRRNPCPDPIFSLKRSLTAASSSSDWERDDIRWLREEQRWLREEQRWVREESRWRSERESLIREIAVLRLKVERLERERAVDAAIGRTSEVGPRPALAEESEVKEIIFEEVLRVSDEPIRDEGTAERKTLRKGSEGEDVRAMQDDTNGAPTTSLSKITEIKEAINKQTGDAEVEVSAHRVFLLGENRWEEPSRLTRIDNPIGGNKVGSPTKCLTCSGEGQLLCTECDGSGEANIEPQFLEWFDERAKCPYCVGLGYTVCDVCEGTAIATALI